MKKAPLPSLGKRRFFFHQKRPLPNENQAKVSQNNVMLPIKPGILIP
jgi:hypothetical protein